MILQCFNVQTYLQGSIDFKNDLLNMLNYFGWVNLTGIPFISFYTTLLRIVSVTCSLSILNSLSFCLHEFAST